MLRVAVMYPNTIDADFDFDYFQYDHLPLVKKAYQAHGLVNLEFDIAVSTTGDNKAAYLAIAYLSFKDMAALMAAMKAEGKMVNADVKNYTSIKPTIQISKSATC
jgi:uncharacterized protein (TIGR02118 family)